MIIEISVAIIAIAFALLAIYLILTLKNLRKTLRDCDRLMNELQPQLETFAKEANRLAHTSNTIVSNLQRDLETFDPLFKSVSNVGEKLEQFTSYSEESERRHHIREEPTTLDKEELVYNLIDFFQLGIILWKTLKRRS